MFGVLFSSNILSGFSSFGDDSLRLSSFLKKLEIGNFVGVVFVGVLAGLLTGLDLTDDFSVVFNDFLVGLDLETNKPINIFRQDYLNTYFLADAGDSLGDTLG